MSNKQSILENLERLAENAGEINIGDLIRGADRADRYALSFGSLHLDYAKHLLTDEILETLLSLAEAAGVGERASALYAGDTINITENRAALHMAERHASTELPESIQAHLEQERQQLEQISGAVRSGEWRGVTGERITDVINIGIGGSDLGPKMVCEALREFTNGPTCHFISNVDGAEILSLLRELDAESTLIVISSKSFTTTESLRNAETAIQWLNRELDIEHAETTPHVLAVTANPEAALAAGIAADRILAILPAIGGRYSLWSAMGLTICIAAGFEEFMALRAGGAAMDQHFLTAEPAENMPILLALLGVWYNNFIKVQNHAIIPYCERLGLFVDHMQQVDMESNGKSVTLSGAPVTGPTGPIIWGQTGTNGQHAFFQLLHQGTQFSPIDFIGVIEDKLSDPAHHRMLLANMIAQGEALMLGRASENAYQGSPGNRPSSTLLLDELTPYSLGMLIALYEHKVFVQAAVWDINPFDQWGVELGKQLTETILDGSAAHDESTAALLRRTGLST